MVTVSDSPPDTPHPTANAKSYMKCHHAYLPNEKFAPQKMGQSTSMIISNFAGKKTGKSLFILDRECHRSASWPFFELIEEKETE